MKFIIFSLLALVCGCNCKVAFAQNKDNPFGNVNTKVVELKVTGMTCQSCADHVTSALSEKPGVVKSEVQYTSNSATVTFDPSAVKEEEIIRTIEEAGYKAEVKTSKDKKEIKKDVAVPHACCVPKKKN